MRSRWFPFAAIVAGLAVAGATLILAITPASAVESPSPAETAADKSEFPDAWYYYGARRPKALRELEGKKAKELSVKNWIGEAQKIRDLKGKVVVIDFWATWCPPCMASLSHNVKLVDEYKDRGLVFIGVHDSGRGHERMADVAKRKNINYPLAIDNAGKSASAYKVSFWPTYVVIDRKGIIRAIGLTPDRVEPVVKKLLEEAAPAEEKS